MGTIKKERNEYDRQNYECAQLILVDVNKNGGEGSLSVLWARDVLAKRKVPAPLARVGAQQQMFGKVA